jgi:hypothetical protein
MPFLKNYPLGRFNTSEDIAAAAVFLGSDECYMTGQNLQVNGGLTLRRNPLPSEIEESVMAAMAAQQAGVIKEQRIIGEAVHGQNCEFLSGCDC